MISPAFFDDKKIILDFDSTVVTREGLEELAMMSLAQLPQPERDQVVAQIQLITNQGMEGKLGFAESLERRMSLLTGKMTLELVAQLASSLVDSISPFFLKHQEFLRYKAGDIYVISGGFEEFIWPTVEFLGIPRNHVFANAFLTQDSLIVGHDAERLAARNNGKVAQLAALQLAAESTVAVGDGSTDRSLKEAGLAKYFFAFTENIERPGIYDSNTGESVADGNHLDLEMLILSAAESQELEGSVSDPG